MHRSNCSVEVKDRATGEQKLILENVSGIVKAGEMIALMGPSGSGKTTLLNVLARRNVIANANVSAHLLVDEQTISLSKFRSFASFVEQEDALIGSLTTRETVEIAAHLSRPGSRRAKHRALAAHLLSAFGLSSCADTLVGTPVRKGISGGQKRRLSVASQLVAAPKILFLDEPTSGLDSTASREVMSFIRSVTQELKLIAIASIHQPSTETFRLFDKLALLSQGRLCYFGTLGDVEPYFEDIGLPMPANINPAEYLLDLVNTDFEGVNEVRQIQDAWEEHEGTIASVNRVENGGRSDERHSSMSFMTGTLVMIPLLERAIIKSYRDVLTYGIRYAMYCGLAIMMGTVWFQLKTEQEYIQSFINAIASYLPLHKQQNPH
jgi:ABC-type multidrug transport system ATPase subunit